MSLNQSEFTEIFMIWANPVLFFFILVFTTNSIHFVKIVHILYHFVNVYLHSFMACTKAIDPRTSPRCLTTLTSTMYEHLYITELIPIV